MNLRERIKGSRFAGLHRDWLLPGILLLAVWLLAIRQLDLEWTINPEYQYGWVVPFLSLLLWWRAWARKPAPGDSIGWSAFPWLIALLAAFAIPVRIIEEANPDWRILNYYYISQAILITALIVHYSGGRPWLRHFAFPLLFPLVSVPWPSAPEHELVQDLQRVIASIGVESASWLGWSAFQNGNLIVLSHGVVGVNEACSGIRSLQSSLMIALFLGDYLQLTVIRRLILVALAFVVAFVLNAVRAFLLIVVMDLHGPDAMSKFHDPAGFSIAFGCLLVLWIAANFMEDRRRDSPDKAQTVSGIFHFPAWSVVVLLIIWTAAEILNQGWYLWHERNSIHAPTWTLQWPPPRPDFTDEPIDETIQSALRYDQGMQGKWTDQSQWEVFFFTWKPGRATTGLAHSHRPDICLPASGFVMKEDLGIKNLQIESLVLPLERYIFQDPTTGRLYYVFQAVTDDKIDPGAVYEKKGAPDQIRRLKAAWNGQRNTGQRSLLVVNFGSDNIDQAEAGVEKLLKDSVVISP